jgi:hypothetical protein
MKLTRTSTKRVDPRLVGSSAVHASANRNTHEATISIVDVRGTFRYTLAIDVREIDTLIARLQTAKAFIEGAHPNDQAD